jgi:hypothetical protein
VAKSIIFFLITLLQISHFGAGRNVITADRHLSVIRDPQHCSFHNIYNAGTFEYLADVENADDKEDDNDPPVTALSTAPTGGIMSAFSPDGSSVYQHQSCVAPPGTPLFLLYRHFLV